MKNREKNNKKILYLLVFKPKYLPYHQVLHTSVCKVTPEVNKIIFEETLISSYLG